MNFHQQFLILINNVTDENGERYTSQQIANTTGISKSLIDKFRQGVHNSPRLETIRTLAEFFRVPLAYFDCKTTDECLDFLNISMDIKFRSVFNTTLQNQQQIKEILAWIQADQEARKHGDESPPMPWIDNSDAS